MRNYFPGKASKMLELETSLHLSQPPLYQASDHSWNRDFIEAIKRSGDHLTWDPAAILSILSFNYVCGDRTLVKEIKRRPWLSSIDADSEPKLGAIPAHRYLWLPYQEIAARLTRLLCDEVERVCKGRETIYILLSGGMDSRVVAGIVSRLIREGRLHIHPIAVTWGLRNSRDVVYGQKVAQILDMDWVHVNIGYENIIDNLDDGAGKLGALIPPVHLHCMTWFKEVNKDTLVLSGSYGDMVGRAEFSKVHLLELDYLRPQNFFGLLKPEITAHAMENLNKDLLDLHFRTPGQPKYVLCEHEMHGQYTRGMLTQAMSIINNYCTVYQVFTDPKVYSFMWSIHPSLRFNEVYSCLLEQIEPKLARLPWARTNKALIGKTEGAYEGLNPKFHDYRGWIHGPLYNQLHNEVDPSWFSGTGLFSPERIEELRLSIKYQPKSFRNYELFVWLAGFRRMVELFEERGISVVFDKPSKSYFNLPGISTGKGISGFAYAIRQIGWLRQSYKYLRHKLIRFQAKLRFPPEQDSSLGN